MNLEEIAERDIRALRGKSGIYWTMSQPEENGEEKILVDRAKNFTVQNWYQIIADTLNAQIGATISNNVGGGALLSQNGTSGTFNCYILGHGIISPSALSGIAGTDTTTASTLALNNMVTPASPTPQSTSCALTAVTGGLQWAVQWAANSFGASGTTVIGEFGLCIGVSAQSSRTMLNRLAVADNNSSFQSPVTVNNSVVYNATITLVI